LEDKYQLEKLSTFQLEAKRCCAKKVICFVYLIIELSFQLQKKVNVKAERRMRLVISNSQEGTNSCEKYFLVNIKRTYHNIWHNYEWNNWKL